MSETLQKVRLLDFYPSRGMLKPGELVRLFLECETKTAGRHTFNLEIFNGIDSQKIRTEERFLDAGFNKVDFSFTISKTSPAGYGAEVTCADCDCTPCKLETAFDVLKDWTLFPRYGFLCDFSTSKGNEETTLQTLAKYHLNGLQFYDWQYRHDNLVPPQEDYLDPLNRPLSLSHTRRLIKSAHSHGMAAMPYLAIYAASAEFWKSHPEWALYDVEHHLIPFGDDFLGIMNPAAGEPWQAHLLGECQKVLTRLPFDGLHIDQYGDPKTGFDANGQEVDLPQAFVDFIDVAASQHPGKPVLFNAVGNWPIENLAVSATAFNYIEVWPPEVHYLDLVKIVRNARKLSGEKPAVIALYMPAARETNHLLADALIYSSGGTRIELGEGGRLLTDPYFPKHEAMSEELAGHLRRRLDFMVRYEEWVGPLVRESQPKMLNKPAGLETFFRKTKKGASLSLVNLGRNLGLCWNEEHCEVEAHGSFELEIGLCFPVSRVWMVNPDAESHDVVPLEFEIEGGITRVRISGLQMWGVLFFER